MYHFVNMNYNLKLAIASKPHFLLFQFHMHFPDKIGCVYLLSIC